MRWKSSSLCSELVRSYCLMEQAKSIPYGPQGPQGPQLVELIVVIEAEDLMIGIWTGGADLTGLVKPAIERREAQSVSTRISGEGQGFDRNSMGRALARGTERADEAHLGRERDREWHTC